MKLDLCIKEVNYILYTLEEEVKERTKLGMPKERVENFENIRKKIKEQIKIK